MSNRGFLRRLYIESGLYRAKSRFTGRQQDQQHRELVGSSYDRMDLGEDESLLQRSRSLLGRIAHNRGFDASPDGGGQMLVIDFPARLGPWFEDEIRRNFEASIFSGTRHRCLFEDGKVQGDLWKSCVGVADEERNASIPEVSDEAAWREQFRRDIERFVRKMSERRPIDLIFVYPASVTLSEQVYSVLRGYNAPVAVWWLDEKHSWKEEAALDHWYDLHLTNSMAAIPWYLSHGMPSYYFPQAIDPVLYEDCDRVESSYDVSFVGGAYGARLEVIKELREAGIAVQCFGRGWPAGEIEDIVEIVKRSKVNLGIGYTGQSRSLNCVKERDFEVPAAGGTYLTTYNYELADLFCIGSEIRCYSSVPQCVEQIRYLLQHKKERISLGQAARERCLTDHNWTQRLKDLLEWLSLNPALRAP